ncbi:MAG: peptide deformylase [Peptostreptococcaceae bacterium]|nr:peptide deformylase [Peptostreptococcaceae bacterium]
MAIRIIKEDGDEVLRKKSRPVEKMTDKISELIDDMIETMYDSEGVGLAAPQVGVLRRVIVVDIDDGKGASAFINPEILEQSGSQTDNEGCLSIPGKFGEVERPQRIKIKYLDREMNPRELVAEDFMARALCHEIDHLDGILFKDKVRGRLYEHREESE